MSESAKRPMIARIWRGRTRRDRADDTEFMTISYWESVEVMSSFTGGDPTRIHHLARDPEFLIDLPERVQIVKIRTSHGKIGGAS